MGLTETILKSRSGIYKDTPENRRLHRVGFHYGSNIPQSPEIQAYTNKMLENKPYFAKQIVDVCETMKCISSVINIKSEKSVRSKLFRDGCKMGDIKDLMRNTFIALDGNTERVIEEVKKKFDVQRIKVQTAEKFDGYSGTIINVRFPNGMIGEVQVNTP